MLVKIEKKIPLFKNGEPAQNIELIKLEGLGFNIVSQKNLYDIGDIAVYVEPDYNLTNNKLFESFISPNGEPKKSKLGSHNRVKAIKFNFQKENETDPVYSNGILLPLSEVSDFLNGKNLTNLSTEEIYQLIGVYKYEEPEKESVFQSNEPFPNGWYRTDETNFLKICDNLEFPLTLVGTVKDDGSSITISRTKICSRNWVKKPSFERIIGVKPLKWWEKVLDYIYRKLDKKYPRTQIRETVLANDEFTTYGKQYQNIPDNIVLRGELSGKSMRGSGNKNNPANLYENRIAFYGIDKLIDGITVPVDYLTFHNLCDMYELPRVQEVFLKTFNSKEEVLQECKQFFKDNLIEGIVCRNMETTISFKVMNDEYDAKK